MIKFIDVHLRQWNQKKIVMTNAVELRTLTDYLKLNYPIVLHADPDGGYVAEIKDLPGCLAQGETIEETMQNINEARKLWLETVFELGKSTPLPSD